ncbi:MAG: ribosome biogenesis GTPase Der, partial [Bacteroidota bacterium]
QVEIAMEEASVLLFVVDGQTGIMPLDEEFAHILRRSEKPVVTLVNKVDGNEHQHLIHDFYSLGFEQLNPVSAESGYGTGDILDQVVSHFEESEEESPHGELPRISIIGRPNVGKSSFLNLLLGEERSIVSDIAGTTRDSIDTHYNAFGKEFLLTDTAGLRRKSRVHENIEFYSVMRTIKAIDSADVCVLMMDATQGFEGQDMSILRLAHSRYKGSVLMVNKWDLIEKETNTARDFERELRRQLGDMAYVPVLFTSITGKQRVFRTIEKAIEVFENRRRRISTSQLNETLLPFIQHTPPPSVQGKYIRIKYITQIPSQVPTFAFFCNYPNFIKLPYKRFLENKLRESFQLEGSPIRLFFRKK